MNDKEILEKAIQQAIDNGWNGFYTPQSAKTYISNREGGLIHVGYDLIFNHDFAKALWGDDGYYYKLNDPKRTTRKLWEHMLQQMVIADDPIKYLGENL